MPNPKSKHPKEKCPICGNVYSKMYLRTHQIQKHNSPLKRARSLREQRNVSLEIQPLTQSINHRRFKHEENFIILTDNEGALWIAEKIR